AEREARAVASRVDRDHVHGCPIEPVGRLQLDLAEQIAPVGRQRRELRLPLLAQRRRGAPEIAYCDWIRREHLENAVDPLLVEAFEQPPDAFTVADDAER